MPCKPKPDMKPIRVMIETALRALGFKLLQGNWYIDCRESLLVVNLQRSRYGNHFYINLGVWFKAIGQGVLPKEYDCHVRIRLETLTHPRLQEALDANLWKESEENRQTVISDALRCLGHPWLKDCSSFKGVVKMHKTGRLMEALIHNDLRSRLAEPELQMPDSNQITCRRCRANDKTFGFAVFWIKPERGDDGKIHSVRTVRVFLAESHGTLRLASRASLRWLDAVDRKGYIAWEKLIDLP